MRHPSFHTQVLPTDRSVSVSVSDVSGLVGVSISVSVLSVAAYACPPAHTRTQFVTASSGGRRPASHEVVCPTQQLPSRRANLLAVARTDLA